MKKSVWFIFIGYFGVFIALGLIFYYHYLDSYLAAGAKPFKVEVLSPTEIYYSAGNSLYQVNPNFLAAGAMANSSEKIVSDREVLSLDVRADHKKVAYSAKNSAGATSIWELTLSSKEPKEISANAATKDFSSFDDPQYLGDSGKLTFLAKSVSLDAVFLFDEATGTYTNLTKTLSAKIAAFSISGDGKKLVVCASADPGICSIIDLTTAQNLSTFNAAVSKIAWIGSGEMVFSGSANAATNLYRIKVSETTPTPITNLSSPKKVQGFSLNSAGSKIAYEVTDSDTTDIYTVSVSGANSIQLTTDQKSFSALISPDGSTVAFARQGEGIYLIGADTTNEQKLLNITEKIDRLLAWR